MRSYFDSSALAKDYVDEAGSETVGELVARAETLGSCVICLIEVMSTLCRCVQERRISRKDYLHTKAHLLTDVADMELVQLTDAVLGRTVQLLEQTPLKSSDALHIASALEWEADVFVSADQRQLVAARRAGLKCISV